MDSGDLPPGQFITITGASNSNRRYSQPLTRKEETMPIIFYITYW